MKSWIDNNDHTFFMHITSSVRTVEAPMMNATTSVSEVILIAEPAWPNVSPILSVNGLFKFDSLVCISFQDALITKISSIPRPKSKNGKDVCTGPYGTPIREHIPTANINAAPTHKRPVVVRQYWKNEEFSLNRRYQIIQELLCLYNNHMYPPFHPIVIRQNR